MKKEKRFPIKEMFFAFLAVSKLVYYLNIIAAADGFEGVLSAMLERFLGRDIIIILLIIFVYSFEYMFVMKQKKWTGNLAQIILIAVGYVMYVLITFIYLLMMNWISSETFNMWSFLELFFIGNLLSLSIIYFIIAGFIFVKETFKKKEAYAYALDIHSDEIKLEMLKAMLDDGDLTQEAFEKQTAMLMEV